MCQGGDVQDPAGVVEYLLKAATKVLLLAGKPTIPLLSSPLPVADSCARKLQATNCPGPR